jgi:phosphoglycerol transferase MdoB-like AlkP superfamily enzyme
MMINYNDPDYVHWGYPSHYTKGISIIDRGLEQLHEFVKHDPEYRGNTIFVVVPDCGRDANSCLSVPYQHHFRAHDIFALFVGPGVAQGQVVDRTVDQIQIAPTVARLMNFPAPFVEGSVLEEVFV